MNRGLVSGGDGHDVFRGVGETTWAGAEESKHMDTGKTNLVP